MISLSGGVIDPARRGALWRIRATMFCQMCAIGLTIAFATVWMKDNGMTETFIGAIVSGVTLLSFAGSQGWGIVADRTQMPHVVAAIGFVVAGLGWGWLSFATEPWAYIIYAVVVGLGMSMFVGLTPMLAASVLGDRGAGRAYASVRMFGSMGWIAGTGVIPLLVAEVHHVILLGAGVCMVAPLILLGFDHPKVEHRHFSPLRQVLANRRLVAVVLGIGFYGIASAAIFRFVPIYARQMGADTSFIGLFMSVNGWVALIGLPLMGLLVDRIGMRPLIVAALIAQPIRLLLYSVAGDLNGLFAVQFIHVITWAGLEIGGVLYVRAVVREGNRATAMALYTGAHSAGMFVGGFLCGAVADHAGYLTMFHTVAAVSGLGIVAFTTLTLLARRTSRA